MPGCGVRHPLRGPEPPVASRAAIIASAAAFPAATPWALDGESGIAAERGRVLRGERLQHALPVGNGMFAGTVDDDVREHVYAAVATAASFEAVALRTRVSADTAVVFGPIALTAS